MAIDFKLEHPLLTVEGFLRFYDTFLPKTNTVREAYEAAEKEFQSRYNHPRYASFESFMQVRTQFRKSQKKKKQQAQQNSQQSRQAA